MARKSLFLLVLSVIAAIAVAFVVWPRQDGRSDQEVLNLLCWTGYEERELLDVFEKAYNVKVNYKTFVGGDQMYSLLTQSKGRYDVVVVDPEYIEKLYAAGRLARLTPSDYDLSDYFDPFKKFPLCRIDGSLYAIVVRFGANGVVYNTEKLSKDDVSSYSVLFDPKVKGKVGIWDWYLPSMGVISRYSGNSSPYDISNEQLNELQRRLDELRPQVSAIHSTPPEMLSALANEQSWIVPAGGEWVAAVLRKQGKPISWAIPKEGGVMWVETLVIPNDAPHPETARKFIQWMITPQAQALLAQREAYNSNVPNKKAYDLLSAEQKDTLRVHNEQDALDLIDSLSIRRLPLKQSESDWQQIWQNFKAGLLPQ